LVMTTNAINQLDNALLCPGRIDMERMWAKLSSSAQNTQDVPSGGCVKEVRIVPRQP
jgi:hypothetical protein